MHPRSSSDAVFLVRSDQFKEAEGIIRSSLSSVSLPSSHAIHQLLAAIQLNSFNMTHGSASNSLYATLFLLAHFNHSCHPNCTASADPNEAFTPGVPVVVRSLVDVEPGEELTISYIDLCQSPAQRQSHLREMYMFECACARCTSPAHPIDPYMDALLNPATGPGFVAKLFDTAPSIAALEAYIAQSAGVLHPLHINIYNSKCALARLLGSRTGNKRDLTRAALLYRDVLVYSRAVYPPNFPILTALIKEAWACARAAGDTKAADMLADEFNASRRICMGARCSRPGCLRLVVAGPAPFCSVECSCK